METITEAIKEQILPELATLRESGAREARRLTVVGRGPSGVETRLDDANRHLGDQSRRIGAMREALGRRIDKTNGRLGHLYQVIVRRDEHGIVVEKVERLESEVPEHKRRLAA